MKCFLACVLALLMLTGSACAESYTVTTDSTWAYAVTLFEGSLPTALQAAVDKTPFAGDAVMQGVMLVEYHQQTNMLNRQIALAAVNHGGTPMLIGFTDPTPEQDNRLVAMNDASVNDGWVCQPVSETLLREGQPFTLAAVQNDVTTMGHPYPALCYGEEQFILTASNAGIWRLLGYTDGTVFLDCQYTPICAYTSDRPQQVMPCYASFLAEDMDGDTFPTTVEAARAYAQAHPDPVTATQAVCLGANLRVKPTTRSDSLGMLQKGVVAEVLGYENQGSWTHVRIGDTEGFVSTTYLHLGNLPREEIRLPLRVCCLNGDTALLETPNGDAAVTLPDGTVLTVLVQSQTGWMYVLLPDDPSLWPMDTQGQYGWIRSDQADVADTRLQLKYR
ncbi:MAG: SH3 domain-containing protein [Aristaeellaceae bacterium]